MEWLLATGVSLTAVFLALYIPKRRVMPRSGKRKSACLDSTEMVPCEVCTQLVPISLFLQHMHSHSAPAAETVSYVPCEDCKQLIAFSDYEVHLTTHFPPHAAPHAAKLSSGAVAAAPAVRDATDELIPCDRCNQYIPFSSFQAHVCLQRGSSGDAANSCSSSGKAASSSATVIDVDSSPLLKGEGGTAAAIHNPAMDAPIPCDVCDELVPLVVFQAHYDVHVKERMDAQNNSNSSSSSGSSSSDNIGAMFAAAVVENELISCDVCKHWLPFAEYAEHAASAHQGTSDAAAGAAAASEDAEQWHSSTVTDITAVATLPVLLRQLPATLPEIVQCKRSLELSTFNQACAHFARLMGVTANRVTQVDVYESAGVRQAFAATKARFAAAGKSVEETWIVHGTSAAALEKIMAQGFKVGGKEGVRVAHGASYGAGVYSSTNPRDTLAYAGTTGKVILARALKGTAGGAQGQGDSWCAAGRSSWVIFASGAQLLPVYVVHHTAK